MSNKNKSVEEVVEEFKKLVDYPRTAFPIEELRQVLTERDQTSQEREREIAEIFKWLLGENGEFPDLSQKPHYSFRTELRQRLKENNITLTNPNKD